MADFAAAEVATIAYISGDENLIRITNDPELDIHAETTKAAFKIDIPEGYTTKQFIREMHNSKRVSSKIILFGLLYGRGPGSLAKQLRVAGVDADTDYAKQIIADVLQAYPKLNDYIQKQHRAVLDPGYAENPFGMRRYFFHSSKSSVMAAQRRASVNFCIQSTVSGVLQLALGNFMKYKEQVNPSIDYQIMLPFHDAIYSVVHHSCAEEYIEKVVPWCMEKYAQVPSIGLQLETDIETEYHWGHPVSLEEAIAESLADL